MTLAAIDYTGHTDETVTGIPCQRWDQQTPHRYEQKLHQSCNLLICTSILQILLILILHRIQNIHEGWLYSLNSLKLQNFTLWLSLMSIKTQGDILCSRYYQIISVILMTIKTSFYTSTIFICILRVQGHNTDTQPNIFCVLSDYFS